MREVKKHIFLSLAAGILNLICLTGLAMVCAMLGEKYPNIGGLGLILLIVLYPLAAIPGTPTWATLLNIFFDVTWLSIVAYLVTLIWNRQRNKQVVKPLSLFDVGTED